ncbi:MAG: hypothetical protein HOK38_00045 [Flavobacteriaceae bacterium]|nr:hypothetical protein [Flavobacteriaceae bacterium]
MRYLLIDYGASFFKSVIYNTEELSYSKYYTIPSPFTKDALITKEALKKIIKKIIKNYSEIDGIISCSILGGGYHDNLYYSWKQKSKYKLKNCIISGLFEESSSFHLHSHHGGNQINIGILGYINKIPYYSNLGDTNCVVKALSLKKNQIALNLGTGSQLILTSDGDTKIYSHFPAGRSFHVFNELFESLNLNIFKLFKTISKEDVISSSLKINLNNFPQSRDYFQGGFISEINEGKFSYKNLLGSLIKSFILQYQNIISERPKDEILLCGGISSKLEILKDLFQFYYPENKVLLIESNHPLTFIGLSAFIKELLI